MIIKNIGLQNTKLSAFSFINRGNIMPTNKYVQCSVQQKSLNQFSVITLNCGDAALVANLITLVTPG